jgi:hypothetical protein
VRRKIYFTQKTKVYFFVLIDSINHDENSGFISTTRPSAITERGKVYDQASRLYKDIEHTQGNNTENF